MKFDSPQVKGATLRMLITRRGNPPNGYSPFGYSPFSKARSGVATRGAR